MWRLKWHKKQASLRRSLKKSYLHRIWGHKLFAGALWKADSRSIAGGLALGLFIGFTPTIPLQMLMGAIGAMYFRVNLPIALVACWVTNPLTAVPIYTVAWKLGKYIVENSAIFQNAVDAFKFEGKTAAVIRHSIYLWFGSLIFSFLSAIITILSFRMFGRLRKQFDSISHLDKFANVSENHQSDKTEITVNGPKDNSSPT